MNYILEVSIIGLLDKLDPHSSYISSEQFELINEQFGGEFEGIGIEFNILEGYITVISPIPGTPSDRAGLQSGDKIVRINDVSAYKITQKEVLEKLIKLSTNNKITYNVVNSRVRPTELNNLVGDCKKFINLTNWKYEKTMDDILIDVLEYWRTFVKNKLY